MIGLKGIPAKWGGIEKYVEEIGAHLANRGHYVTVFGSNWYCKDFVGHTYRGMQLVRLPVFHTQATDALNNALLASLIVIFSKYDIVHFHNYAAYYFVPFVKLFGKITVITSHGLVDDSWRNPKYNSFATRVIINAGKVGMRSADRVTTVADYWRQRIQEYCGRDADVLPSGLDDVTIRRPNIIKEKYGLCGDDFILFLGRIDPVKRIEWLAKLRCQEEKKIVIAGGAQDAATQTYYSRLHEMSSRQTVFTGPVYGAEKEELLSNCRLFVNPSITEGLPITVLEAMSYGRCCVASSIPSHSQIIRDGQTGFLFDKASENELRKLITKLLSMTKTEIQSIGMQARKELEGAYDWAKTSLSTERIYWELVHKRRTRK